MQICYFGTVRIVVILLFYGDDEIDVVLLNSPLLFSTNNPNNISTIRNSIIFFTILALTEKSLFFHGFTSAAIIVMAGPCH
jgi:hypothetical protein